MSNRLADRLAYIVAIRFFEPSLYFLELLWHAIWSFGGAYVLTAAETWIVLSFGNEHSKAIHLKLLSSAESFRRMHALLHVHFFFFFFVFPHYRSLCRGD
eukprot:TRINITY_DN14537_c0_g1_i24.p1 TRINITY_DN14537_c0_g1~~TRINITY_DN14537_c0_g1_i24.p1  ORF type:complete len:100 (+),score=15.20 TRINITY_DN14537_c0_g1_i24:236-535(+)